ncbi:MAG: imidazole glycerol phosphate synthase subunit HisH [Gammaproteobacteria bacterium]|nr:imidazole glycerol phosphate synthase subunit HisH [Gammaproteobacteria bacterium]
MDRKQSVAVIDYGTSNLRSVAKALEHVADRNTRISVTGEPGEILSADRIVFPGQGAIGQCMQHLQEQGLDDCIREVVSQKPFLGICLGLQSLMETSDEDGGTPGLHLFSGQVVRFQEPPVAQSGTLYKIPHMGWNQVLQKTPHALWNGIKDASRFYFVHSYYVVPQDRDVITGTTEYITEFTSAIARDNIFACQFHPEKSQQAGLKLLENFLGWQP